MNLGRQPATYVRVMIVKKLLWLCILGVAVGCSPTVQAPIEEEAPAPASESRDKSFDSDGVQIRYAEQGEGDPLILIHGFAMSHDRWEAAGILDAFAARGYRVLAIDARGHGGSGKPHDPIAYGEQISLDVVRLIEHLGLEQAYVAGHSMGAIVTNKVRSLAPEKVRAAVLGGAGWQKKGDTVLPGITALELAEALEETGNFKWMLREFTKDQQPPATEEEIEGHNKRMMYGNDTLALAAVLRGWDGLAVTEEDLRANEVPTLALVGGDDPLKEKVDDLDGVMSNLQIVVIPDADHFESLTDPAFVENIDAFLGEHPLAGSEPETEE